MSQDHGTMWLQNTDTIKLERFDGENIPEYAILSHRWEDGEVSFKDIQKDRGRNLQGYSKILECCEQAKYDGLFYVWIDTCCIDKRSSAELSEAINSMYRWYQNSSICYAYLSDVELCDGCRPQVIGNSIWFTRGWTLQELLAPKTLVFFDVAWNLLGTKGQLSEQITRRTDIPQKALKSFDRTKHSVATIMSWAIDRQTTRVEDRAYSLLGLFDINMPLLYGEGHRAFLRLQHEIISTSKDASIFLSSEYIDPQFGMLASAPEAFRGVSCKPLLAEFDISKSGISGRFSLEHIDSDVYMVGFRDTSATCYLIFLKWHMSLQQFHRTTLDDQHFQSADNLITINSPWRRDTTLRIGRSERRNDRSFVLDSPPGWYSDPCASAASILSGKYFKDEQSVGTSCLYISRTRNISPSDADVNNLSCSGIIIHGGYSVLHKKCTILVSYPQRGATASNLMQKQACQVQGHFSCDSMRNTISKFQKPFLTDEEIDMSIRRSEVGFSADILHIGDDIHIQMIHSRGKFEYRVKLIRKNEAH